MAYDAQVAAAQQALNGWWEVTPKLDVDGLFGPETARGVRQFQQRVGLPITGQLDAATLQRLGVAGQGGFLQWSQAARQAQDAADKAKADLDRFISGLSPTSANFQYLFTQANQLQAAAQQTQQRAAQSAQTNAPDPALAQQIELLKQQVTQLTGQPPSGDIWTKLGISQQTGELIGVGLALFLLFMIADR